MKASKLEEVLYSIYRKVELEALKVEYRMNYMTLACLIQKYDNNKNIAKKELGEFEEDYCGCIDPYIKISNPVDKAPKPKYKEGQELKDKKAEAGEDVAEHIVINKLKIRLIKYLDKVNTDLNEPGINRRTRTCYLSNTHIEVRSKNKFVNKQKGIEQYSVPIPRKSFNIAGLDANALYYPIDILKQSTLLDQKSGREWELAMLCSYEVFVAPLRIYQSALTHLLTKLGILKKQVQSLTYVEEDTEIPYQQFISQNNLLQLITQNSLPEDVYRDLGQDFAAKLVVMFDTSKQNFLRNNGYPRKGLKEGD